jgi:hypothetical protein
MTKATSDFDESTKTTKNSLVGTASTESGLLVNFDFVWASQRSESHH